MCTLNGFGSSVSILDFLHESSGKAKASQDKSACCSGGGEEKKNKNGTTFQFIVILLSKAYDLLCIY